jgi:hypothetical protein
MKISPELFHVDIIISETLCSVFVCLGCGQWIKSKSIGAQSVITIIIILYNNDFMYSPDCPRLIPYDLFLCLKLQLILT